MNRTHPTIAPIQDPAELAYNAYGAALGWRGPKKTPLKLWHELAVQDRTGWRAAWVEFRHLLVGGDRLVVNRPLPDMLQIVACDKDGAYVMQQIPKELLLDKGALEGGIMEQVLNALEGGIAQLHKERDEATGN
jgi:hypothetical protein